jgi:hypothetical protein
MQRASLVRKRRRDCPRQRRLANFGLLGTRLAIHKFQVAGAQPGQRHGCRVAVLFQQTHLAILEANQPAVAGELAGVIGP